MGIFSLKKSGDGVSPALKIFVFILTSISIGLLLLLFFKLMGKGLSFSKKTDGGSQLEMVANRLNKEGLSEQAIEQYKNFLNQPKIGQGKRSQVSRIIAELYFKVGSCPDTLAWFIQSEMADPDAPLSDNNKSQIASCKKQLKESSS